MGSPAVVPLLPRPAAPPPSSPTGSSIRERLHALVRQGRRGTTVAVLCALLAVPAAVGAWALSAPAGAVGHDVSYPQCGGSLPSGGTFGIVGVNGGRVSTSNPCLSSQYAWATGMSNGAALYVNTGNPGSISTFYWPASGTSDPALCTDRTSAADAGCAYDYGWHGAANSLGIAQNALGSGVTDRSWWLDVEVANSWNGTTTANAAALQGAVDRLRTAGIATVGIYSTATQWSQITGGYTGSNASRYRAAWAGAFTPVSPMESAPNWIAGLSSLDQAAANCGVSFTGATAMIAQYTDDSTDGDLMCGGTASPPGTTPPTSTTSSPTTSTSAPTSASTTSSPASSTTPTTTSMPASPPATTSTTTTSGTATSTTSSVPTTTSSTPPTTSATPKPTAAPTGLTATGAHATVTLAWTAPSGSAAGTTYTVYRGGPGSVAPSIVAQGLTATTWTDRTVTDWSTYRYWVAAATTGGVGPASYPVTVTPSPYPGAPANVVARTASTRGIALTWAVPAANGGSPVTRYYVLRGTAPGRETVLGSLTCTTPTCAWQDTSITGGQAAYYQLVAVNAANVAGPRSVEVGARGR